MPKSRYSTGPRRHYEPPPTRRQVALAHQFMLESVSGRNMLQSSEEELTMAINEETTQAANDAFSQLATQMRNVQKELGSDQPSAKKLRTHSILIKAFGDELSAALKEMGTNRRGPRNGDSSEES